MQKALKMLKTANYTDNEIGIMADRNSKRTPINTRVQMGLARTKALKAITHWVRKKLREGDDELISVMLGDHCAGDSLIKRDTADDDDGFPVDTSALVMLDKATGWVAVYPKASTSTPHTSEAMRHFDGPADKIKLFDCVNAPELIAGARHCKRRLATATTGMPHTNGVAERAVRAVKEGGRCGIVQSGFSSTSWSTSS